MERGIANLNNEEIISTDYHGITAEFPDRYRKDYFNMWKTMNEATLSSKKVGELREIAKTFGLKGYEKMRKAELIEALKTEGEAEQDAPEKK